MSTETAVKNTPQEEGFAPYRAVSKAAVVSMILGLISILGFFSPVMLMLAVAGSALGVIGFRTISRYPNELSGKPIAVVGAILGVLVLAGGIARHSYVYATEVPEGHLRISFMELQPEEDNRRMPVPESALALDGKKVFVKGYIHPASDGAKITKFILVPDLGTCCFGGQPKLTDMIEVTLEKPLQTSYNMKKRKLAGELKVDMALKPVSGLNGVYYQLKADHLR